MDKKIGRVTLPAETGQEETVKYLIKHWGVDAIRDSDGTTLSDDIFKMGFPIYSTICLVRAEQMWPREHPTHLPQMFLMTPRQTYIGEPLEFDLMKDWAAEKYRVNEDDDPQKWWDVIDRTTGEFIPPNDWHYKNGKVVVEKGENYHEYTVNFLVYQIWDSCAMYNTLTNNWKGEKIMCVDPVVPEVYEHLLEYFDEWLAKHPHTNVVRLTTLAFPFMLLRNENNRCVIRDWCGYCEAVSPVALKGFEKKKGYRLRGEDFIQAGTYAHSNNQPTQKMLDWMDFIEDFAIRFGKDLVDKIHNSGKQAAMFWGDHWIGAEPFSRRFAEMGIDILVGAAEDGNALRRVSDVTHTVGKELRLYPYFFPDVFKPGADPIEESKNNWMKIRRALLRKPVDRIGWGGYLSLASKFPEFIDHLANVTNEFRMFLDETQCTPAWTAPIKVGVLNTWGKLRSWMVQTGPIEKFYCGREDIMEFVGTNINETLAGLPVDVEFLSFEDILSDESYLDQFDVIINEGFMGSAWSGGDVWKNPRLVSSIRKWVYNGGGFIGIGHPSAVDYSGKVFQLSDILGVDIEIGKEIQISEQICRHEPQHFITENLKNEKFKTVNQHSYIFSRCSDTLILDIRDKHIHLACKTTSAGRSVYISSLPFDLQNARLLHRAIFWAAGKEGSFYQHHSSNPNTHLAYYPTVHTVCIANSSSQIQRTDLFNKNGKWIKSTTLAPNAMVFLKNLEL